MYVHTHSFLCLQAAEYALWLFDGIYNKNINLIKMNRNNCYHQHFIWNSTLKS